MIGPQEGDLVKVKINADHPSYLIEYDGVIAKVASYGGFYTLEGVYRPYPYNHLPLMFLRSELKKLYKISKNKLTLKLYANKIEKEEGDYIWVS